MMSKPPTAQEMALLALRAAIGSGELQPAQQIVQEDLSAILGVSRVPLREALKTLEAEGLVTYYPHRGYFVTELSVADLREVYRLREILEAEALTLAVQECTAADLDVIEGLLAELEQVVADGRDVRAITARNRAFHFAIFDTARRPRLTRLIRQLWDATDVYRSVYFKAAANRTRIAREHRAMLKALRQRDARALIEIQSTHRANAVAAVAAAIEAGDAAPNPAALAAPQSSR